MKKIRCFAGLWVGVFLAAMLVACGGGGGSNGGGASGGFPPVVVAPAPAPEVVPPVAPESAPCTVVMYGDSILYGYTSKGSLSPRPVDTVQKALPGVMVSDFSAPGDTVTKRTGDLLSVKLNYGVLVLQFGINDAAQRLAYSEPLRSIVAHAQASGAKVVITGLSQVTAGVPNWSEYEAIARTVAKETGAVYADWPSVPFAYADNVDPFHPGQDYSTRLAERLAQTIGPLLVGCKS